MEEIPLRTAMVIFAAGLLVGLILGFRGGSKSKSPSIRDQYGMVNFSPHAQQVLVLARKEADRFNHNFVGTEHLLLGLIKLDQGVAVNVLRKFGLDLEKVPARWRSWSALGQTKRCLATFLTRRA
jgi:hypothetical protein